MGSLHRVAFTKKIKSVEQEGLDADKISAERALARISSTRQSEILCPSFALPMCRAALQRNAEYPELEGLTRIIEAQILALSWTAPRITPLV